MKKNILIIVTLTFLSTLLFSCSTSKMKPNPDSKVPYIDKEWVSVWADEFDGDTLDLSKWTYEIDGGGGGNNELQYYTNKNAEVSDGSLKIHAKKENIQGRKYSSSRIVSKYKGDFRYGRVVASAKMPVGRGTWPAIWMMPTESKYGVWPNSGEIDIMEYVGYEPDVFHSSIHTKSYNHGIGTEQTSRKAVANAATEFHKFELIWEPGQMEMLVNDERIALYKYTAAFNQNTGYEDAFPFDEKFFLIINLAVGGNWGGVMGVDETIFPATLELDYIRYYQKDYGKYDKEKPTVPTRIHSAIGKKNSIFFLSSTDDMGVEYYNVYLDGELYDKTNLSQITLKNLEVNKKYSIQIEAVDFTGKKSDLSEKFEYTFK